MAVITTRYLPDARVNAQDLGDRILLAPPTGAYLVLEGTAATVWRLLDGTRTVADVATECARHYRGDPEQVRADVADTMRDWTERGLVVAAGQSAAAAAP